MREQHLRQGPISRRERFTIAHEIGHYVLLQEANFRPRRRRDYWVGEALCQDFASRLLVRPQVVEDVGPCDSSSKLIDAVNMIARCANVSPEPAARVLVTRVKSPVAVGTFLLDPRRSTKRLGFRAWWSENQQWWGAGGGRRLAVYVDHPLAPVLREMNRLRPWQVGSPSVEGACSTTLRRRGWRWGAFAAVLTG